MEKGLTTNKQIIPQTPVNPLTTTIIKALESGDKFEVNRQLKQFKAQNGALLYERILSMPLEDRLPGLIAKVGLKKVHQTLAVAVTIAMETLNLKQPLTPNQIIDLVDILIDSSSEDYLSLEDILLFLQQLARGVMGTLFSAIDIPKIMGALEDYRQKRHLEYLKIKQEQDAQYKGLGADGSKFEKDPNVDAKTFLDLWQTYQNGKNEDFSGNMD